MYVGHVGRRRAYGAHHSLFAIHADVRLQTEIPLVSLLGLMRLRVGSPVGFLVEQGAWIIVASMIVSVAIRMPLVGKMRSSFS